MWMPAQTTTPPLTVAASAAGSSAPTGAKIRAASSAAGGAESEPPAHAQPSARAKACPASSCGRVNAKISRPLRDRDLRDQVRRRAEAVESDARGVAGHAQRAVADQSRAQQRRGVHVIDACGQREAVVGAGNGVLRIAAVARVAGELRRVAEVFAP